MNVCKRFNVYMVDSLLFFESGAVAKRIQDLYDNPFKTVPLINLSL